MRTLEELKELYVRECPVQDFKLDPKGLYEAASHLMSVPGKRIRPLMVLAACEAFGGDASDAIPAARAVDLFHDSTLVHDDILDSSTVRRGIPSVHARFGIGSAILAGDVLFAYAYRQLERIPARFQSEAYSLLTATAIQVMEGQQRDADFETAAVVTEEGYVRMVADKTAALMACSLGLGALAAGASAPDRERIQAFGTSLGISFQMMDDWLDAFGDPAETGKERYGDIRENKRTCLLAALLEQARPEDAAVVTSLLAQEDASRKIPVLLELYEKYDIGNYILGRAHEFHDKAFASLHLLSLPEERTSVLSELARRIASRKS